jgi:hypothetical protein
VGLSLYLQQTGEQALETLVASEVTLMGSAEFLTASRGRLRAFASATTRGYWSSDSTSPFDWERFQKSGVKPRSADTSGEVARFVVETPSDAVVHDVHPDAELVARRECDRSVTETAVTAH